MWFLYTWFLGCNFHSLLDENPTPNESEIKKNAIEEIYADVLVINKLLILLKQRVNY